MTYGSVHCDTADSSALHFSQVDIPNCFTILCQGNFPLCLFLNTFSSAVPIGTDSSFLPKYDDFMEKSPIFRKMAFAAIVLLLAGALSAQRTPDKKLIVNGTTTEMTVLQIDGHSYVDIETLAQATSGSVKFELDRVVLTIPGSNSGVAAAQAEQGLSKPFASAAIATFAEMKEWRGALGALVTYGLAIDGTWAQIYHQRVEASIAQASVAASTDSDRNALQLLSAQFANLARWESVVTAERKDLNGARTVAPNSLQNDPVVTKFSSCSKFLSTMLGSGLFADNSNCD